MAKRPYHIKKNKSAIRVFLIICLSLFVFGLVMSFHQVAAADSEQASLLEIYREKKYKGAADEEDLKVQTNIQTSDSAKKKSAEADEGF